MSFNTVLNGLEWVVLLVFVVAAFAPWFGLSKLNMKEKSFFGVIHFFFWIVVSGGVAAALMQYFKKVTTPAFAQVHLQNPDGVNKNTWEDALWILLLSHLFFFQLAKSARYGRLSIVSSGIDVRRWWATIVYTLVALLSITIVVMSALSELWIVLAFHAAVAALFIVWSLILNFGGEFVVVPASKVIGPNGPVTVKSKASDNE